MRADRLLTIVLLLQRRQQMKAKTLAEMLGVTQRTIYRDIDALSLAGIPVYTRTGPNGGCFLDEQYRSSLNWFTGDELQTLMFTGTATPLTDLGMAKEMDNAVLKLLSLVPGRYQQEAEKMQQRLYLDPAGWYGITDDHSTLPLLKVAVWEDRLIDCTYENWEGLQHPRTLAPHSLVYKSDRWYLVAKQDGKMRTYRVSRVRDVELLPKSFERDPEFEIATYWEQASAQFSDRLPSYPVTLRVKPYMMMFFKTIMPGRYTILEETDNDLVLDVQFTVFEEARTAILGMGTSADVIAPQELHDAVVKMARDIVAKYD